MFELFWNAEKFTKKINNLASQFTKKNKKKTCFYQQQQSLQHSNRLTQAKRITSLNMVNFEIYWITTVSSLCLFCPMTFTLTFEIKVFRDFGTFFAKQRRVLHITRDWHQPCPSSKRLGHRDRRRLTFVLPS